MRKSFVDPKFDALCGEVKRAVGPKAIEPATVIDGVAKKGYAKVSVRRAIWHLVDIGELDFTADYRIKPGSLK